MKSTATNGWGIWSRHGTVILYVAARPGSSVADIASGLNLTQRTIRDIVADLRRVEMLNVSRRGRRLHFTVNLDAKFRHPTIKDVSLQTLVGGLTGMRAAAVTRPLLAAVSR